MERTGQKPIKVGVAMRNLCSFCGAEKIEGSDRKFIQAEKTGKLVCFNCIPFLKKVLDFKISEDERKTARPPEDIRTD